MRFLIVVTLAASACTSNTPGDAADATVEAGGDTMCSAPTFTAMTAITTFTAGCSLDGGTAAGDAAAGSVNFNGNIVINNTGTTAVTNLGGSEAHVTDLGGTMVLATIPLQPFSVASLAGGATMTVPVMPSGAAVTPANVCATTAIVCGQPYRVVIPLHGDCLSGVNASSEPAFPCR